MPCRGELWTSYTVSQPKLLTKTTLRLWKGVTRPPTVCGLPVATQGQNPG
jgi:type IV secretory pathway VirB3-like protein